MNESVIQSLSLFVVGGVLVVAGIALIAIMSGTSKKWTQRGLALKALA